MKFILISVIICISFLTGTIVYQNNYIKELQNTISTLYNVPMDCSAICEIKFEEMGC